MTPAPPSSSPAPAVHGAHVVTAGKFLQLADGAPHFMRGISYGPFKPNSRGEPFPEDERLASDLRHIASLGFNTVRFTSCPRPVLREVESLGLRLVVGIPWTEHVDFLANPLCAAKSKARIAEPPRDLGRSSPASPRSSWAMRSKKRWCAG
jgi:hypothetical protein